MARPRKNPLPVTLEEKEAKALKEIQDAIAAGGKTVEEWIAA